MKKKLMLLLLGLVLIGSGACTSVQPLKMNYYRKNIIVKADETIWLNGVQLKLDHIRSALVAQMVLEETPIAIHFHENLTQDSFDRIMNKLKSEGFKNYHCTVYRD